VTTAALAADAAASETPASVARAIAALMNFLVMGLLLFEVLRRSCDRSVDRRSRHGSYMDPIRRRQHPMDMGISRRR
jgi:hypothetical protein